MAIILPFRAYRPAPHTSAEVASQSYDSYDPDVRDSLINGNNASFLKIIGGAYKAYPKSPQKRYKAVRKAYEKAIKKRILIQDPTDSIYIYKIQTAAGKTYLGAIACLPVASYNSNIIRKHEDTLTARESVFETYLNTVNFNAEPVLISFPDNELVEQLLNQFSQSEPIDQFECSNGHRHSIWVVTQTEEINTLKSVFKNIPHLYIADGHHRAASSSRLANMRKDQESQQFLTFLIPESQLQILEFNRFITDLNGHSDEEFLSLLNQSFEVTRLGQQFKLPTTAQQFTLYLKGQCYELNVVDHYFSGIHNPLEKLDVYILNTLVFEPLLGITDLKLDVRVQFAPGNQSVQELQNKVDQGVFKAVFGLYPIAAAEIRKVADQNLTLPPKSTYILPKLLSGLTIYDMS